MTMSEDGIKLTNYHNSEVKTLSNRLAMMLVGQVGDCGAYSRCMNVSFHCSSTGQEHGHAQRRVKDKVSMEGQTDSRIHDYNLHPTYPASFLDMAARGFAVSGVSWPVVVVGIHG